ncbi:MAG: signal recognition particle-docking protein FtsY [Spirochaetaceae bacterium]|jgi:fused signal recognition particle receptor|nr:signal recognition particle-docking protein FtsY [Spirochaetaceae bacterium]
MAFADKIKAFFGGRGVPGDEELEGLSDLLVEGDFGAGEAFQTADALRERCRKEKCADGGGAKKVLGAILLESLAKAGVAKRLPLSSAVAVPRTAAEPAPLSVILLLGVNGVGKTTTAAKLCAYYAAYRPVLAAADTFRAGAIDQLKHHGERLGVRVVAHKSGGDPAAVVYDAIKAADADGSRLVIADTAGRMHTKKALVEELKKIDRIIQNADNSGDGNGEIVYLKYLVLDATTGRNAVGQAEIFHEAVKLDGVILSKTDSTAKGGVVFSLAGQFALPTAFLCSGEQYADMSVFEPERFVSRFLGE